MTEISGGRWDIFLRRLFNVKALPIAPSIAPEVTPTIPVEAIGSPELYFLRGFQRWAAGVRSAGANLNQVTIQNNTADQIVVVEGSVIRPGGTPFVRIGFDATPVGAVAGETTFTDGREVLLVTTRRPSMAILTSSNAASAITQGFVSIPPDSAGNILIPVPIPFIIGPQQRLIYESQTVAVTLDMFAWGYLRAIEPTED